MRYRYLNKINFPSDLRNFKKEDLKIIADELRNKTIETVSQTGGHLGAGLGVVELTIALHKVFETPNDKFLFDVSHQGYVHKMLTGRWNQIDTIRQYEGLNGFLLRSESEHDCYGAGHAGTALSAALGMAMANKMKGSTDHVVAVAGDAAFTCGPTFEALNNVSNLEGPLIIVLNDNEWSIDKNVGAIAKYFNKITTSKAYAGLHEAAANFVSKRLGDKVSKIASKT